MFYDTGIYVAKRTVVTSWPQITPQTTPTTCRDTITLFQCVSTFISLLVPVRSQTVYSRTDKSKAESISTDSTVTVCAKLFVSRHSNQVPVHKAVWCKVTSWSQTREGKLHLSSKWTDWKPEVQTHKVKAVSRFIFEDIKLVWSGWSDSQVLFTNSVSGFMT